MPGGKFFKEEKLLPGHITVSINSFYDIVMYVRMCTCDYGKGEGGTAFLHYLNTCTMHLLFCTMNQQMHN
jgi:hypothetical protein